MDQEENNFEVGDTVKLKSGGPVMTISAWMSKGMAICRWFPIGTHETESSEEFFPVECLNKVI
jgi:uncharacterized protein YodC (DUF2158 family)